MAALCHLLTGWLARCGFGPGLAARLACCVLLAAGLVLSGIIVASAWAVSTHAKARLVENRLDSTMAGAVAANAVDAINMVQARAASEDAIEGTVNHAQSAIRAASDSADADAAGRDGLCAIAASFCPATSVQHNGAR